MRVRVPTWVYVLAMIACCLTAGGAQEGTDPRIGLKPGLTDPGVAARGLELVAHVPKPKGFFDPKSPAGQVTPPEKPGEDDEEDEKKKDEKKKEPEKPFTALDFGNSDVAFQGRHVFVGNFSGFNVYDIADPTHPQLVTSVVCPGGQGDVSVHGPLLFMSRVAVGVAMGTSLVLGFAAVRRGDIGTHRAWMVRAYALALGAGTQAFTEGFTEALVGAGELSGDLAKLAGWVINLTVAEWAIRRTSRPRTRSGIRQVIR